MPYGTAVLAQCHFLHSLHLTYHTEATGAEPLHALQALAALTELRELTLEVSGNDGRLGHCQLGADEVFPLEWLDRLPQLRYLHMKAYSHTSLATLQSLGLLRIPPQQPHSAATTPPALPVFVSRVEEFGLDLYEQRVEPPRAAEFDFSAWTRLRRCAVQYPALLAGGKFDLYMYISTQSEAANAVLRERVGADRWCTEAELVAGRLDARWRREHASAL